MTSWERHEARRAARDAAREARRRSREERDDATVARAALDVEGVRRVSINQTAGKLTVGMGAPGEGSVEAVSAKQAPELEVRREGDQLRIEVKLSLGRLFRKRQGATVELVLPPGLDELRIEVGYGKVVLDGTDAAQTRVEVGAGDIEGDETEGALHVEVGAGRVALRRHAGTVRCEAGTGDVMVDVAEAPPGEYRLNAGMGSAELRLPPGLQVNARVNSGIGKGSIEYPVAAEGSPIRVDISAGIGRAVLKERDASAAPETAGRQRPQRPGAVARGSTETAEMRVIQLLEQGRITAAEAASLIAALKGQGDPGDSEDGPN